MSTFDRRDFLKVGAGAAALTPAFGSLLYSEEAAAALGSTLNIAYHVPLPSWDPTTGLSAVNPQLMSIYKSVFDQYVDQNPDLSFKPGILTEWGWNDDKTKVRMVVREGVKWQDGEPLTAEDVIWNLQRVGNPKSGNPVSFVWASITNLKADGTVMGITCASIDITHRKRNEEQMRLVMRELTHRTKNLLTVVIAIARQTSAQATTVDAFVPALIARLRALSAAQDLIVADEWAGVDIGDLVRVLIGQFMPPHSSRVTIDGPEVVLSPEASQNLGLAIHELAANAVQYGAFANAKGTLEVGWSIVPDGTDKDGVEGEQLCFTWIEAGGPSVSEPTRRGFGMTVIERNLARALRAKVDLVFSPTGLSATITVPMEGIVPFASPDRTELARAS